MSNSTLASVLRDPLLLRDSSPLFGPDGRTQLRAALTWTILGGLLDGAALISLLPAATSLATGEPHWGLPLRGWLLALVVLAIAGGFARYHAARRGYASALDFMAHTHEAIGTALATLPIGWFRSARTGPLSRLVSDGFMLAASMFAHVIGGVVAHAALLAIVLVGTWFWHPGLGLLLTVAAPFAFGMMLLAQWLKRWSSARTDPSNAELAARIVEYATCQPALRAAGRAGDFEPLRRAGEVNDRARRVDMWWSLLALVANGIVVQFVVVGIITLSAQLVVDGALGPVETIAFIGVTLRFTRSLASLGEGAVGIDMARAPLAEIHELLNSPTLPTPEIAVDTPAPGTVEFDSVTFGYDRDRPVLRDLSFTAAPGTVTAIVGPSGAGKTTIARLVARFWDVDSGAVRVGGVDVREQTTEQLMAQLSMVFQDVYLFDDTLAANIRVGREDATDAEVRAAADLAGVTSIAERLPRGWDSRVGEGGRSLSGGERQRVSIARALLKESPVVLFDEATSALDAENEANVLASVDTLRSRSTFLVIAHKLDTVRSADQILVLDDTGRLAEQGTHASLYAANGPYRRFWERREAAAGWTLTGDTRHG